MALLDFMQSHGSQNPVAVESVTEPPVPSLEAPVLEVQDTSETEANTAERNDGSSVPEPEEIAATTVVEPLKDDVSDALSGQVSSEMLIMFYFAPRLPFIFHWHFLIDRITRS